MKKQVKNDYATPQLTVVSFVMEQGFQGSVDGPFSLGNNGKAFSNGGSSDDPWSDPSPSGSNRFGGAWTNKGGDAWE